MTSSSERAARHERLTELFTRASALDPSERAEFLARECGSDGEMRAELEGLWAGEERELGLLDGADDPRRQGGLVGMLASADEHWIGCEIGGCTLVELLGVGGMGAVYRARQTNPRRDVALKLLRSASLGDAALRRFEAETRLLAHLQHPGIAKVHAAGVHEQGPLRIPYCTLELIENGLSITAFADRNELDVHARLRLFLQACDALQHAHERRVIHRDVKPDNLLVDSAGQVRVIDFGIARVLADEDQHEGLTRTGHLLGTPAYMSPEQVEGKSEELDTRADVYSLGVVLYQLLSGRLPIDIEGATLLEISRRILDEEPRKLSVFDESLRGDVETIVAKALSKDAARRYSSAGSLAADLRRYLNFEPINARPATAMYQISKFARRHRGLAMGVMIAALALFAGAALALWSAIQAVAARDAAQQLAYDANVGGAASALVLNDASTARRRLDASPPALRGWEWRHLRARLDDASVVLTDNTEPGWLFPLSAIAFERDREDAEQLVCASVVARGIAECVDVRRFDPSNGRELGSWQSEAYDFVWPALEWGSLWLATRDAGALRFDIESGSPQGRVDLDSIPAQSGRTAIVPIDRERAFVIRRLGGRHAVVDFETRTLAPPPPLPPDEAVALVRGPSADGRALISFARTVCWTPLDAESPRLELRWECEPVLGFAAHPDGARVFAAGQDGMLHVVRRTADELALERSSQAHVDSIIAIAISPDGAWLATGGKDRTVRIWDADELVERATLVGPDTPVVLLDFSADGQRLAAVDQGGAVRVFDEPARPDPRVLRAPQSYNYTLEISPDERWIATGDWDGCVRLWDRESGELVVSVPLVDGEDRHIESLSWFPCSRRIAAIGWSGRGLAHVAVLDLARARLEAPVPPSENLTMRAVCALDEHRYVTANRNAVRVHAVDTGAELARVVLPEELVGVDSWSLRWRVRRSFDGRRFAVGFSSGWVALIDSATLRIERQWLAHQAAVHDVAWSRDGRKLVSASLDRSARVFDTASGRLEVDLVGHSAGVFSAVFSGDSKRVFTASDDRTVRVWDGADGRELARLVGHQDYVFSIDCGSDDRVASCSGDRTVRLWDERSRAELLEARRERARLERELTPRVEAEYARGGAEASWDAFESAVDLNSRERAVALQLLAARSLANVRPAQDGR